MLGIEMLISALGISKEDVAKVAQIIVGAGGQLSRIEAATAAILKNQATICSHFGLPFVAPSEVSNVEAQTEIGEGGSGQAQADAGTARPHGANGSG